jgi:hypothetical protein
MHALLGNPNAPRTALNIHFENYAEMNELAYVSASGYFTSNFLKNSYEICEGIVSISSQRLFVKVSDGFFRAF